MNLVCDLLHNTGVIIGEIFLAEQFKSQTKYITICDSK